MKVNLQHRIFTESPYNAFANRYKTSPKLWREMYDNRYKWHQYEIPILCEYFKLKTGVNVNDRTLRRWIKRTEVFKKAQYAIQKGAKEVSYTYFESILTEKEFNELFT